MLVVDPNLRRVCEQVTIAAWGTPLKVAVTGLLASLVVLEDRNSEASGVFLCPVSYSPTPTPVSCSIPPACLFWPMPGARQ